MARVDRIEALTAATEAARRVVISPVGVDERGGDGAIAACRHGRRNSQTLTNNPGRILFVCRIALLPVDFCRRWYSKLYPLSFERILTKFL